MPEAAEGMERNHQQPADSGIEELSGSGTSEPGPDRRQPPARSPRLADERNASLDDGPNDQPVPGTSATQDTKGEGDYRLTADEPSRVKEAALAQEKTVVDRQLKPAVWLVILKWITVILIALAFIGCLTVSKLTILHMGMFLNFTNHTDSCKSGAHSPESTFLMMLITLLIPYVLTLVRSVWCGGFRRDKLWPSRCSLAWAVGASLVESAGITLFTIVVITESPSYISVIFSNSVFLPSIVWQVGTGCRSYCRSQQQEDVDRSQQQEDVERSQQQEDVERSQQQEDVERSASSPPPPPPPPPPVMRSCFGDTIDFLNRPHNKCTLVVNGLALVFALVGIVLSIVFEVNNKGIADSKLWALPVSLVLLALAWCPQVQKQQLYPCKEQLNKLVGKKRIMKHSEVAGMAPTTSLDQPQLDVDIDDPDLAFNKPQYSARWKSSMVSCTLKIVFVIGFQMLFGYTSTKINMHCLGTGIIQITSANPIFIVFLLSIFSSFVGYALGWLSCSMNIQRAAFALPLILATPVTLIVCLLREYDVFDFGLARITHPKPATESLKYTLTVAICLYISQLLSTTCFICQTFTIIMQRESQLFWLPGYSSVFLEQMLLLTRKNAYTDRSPELMQQQVQRTQIIICTTMYREAPLEMKQLLQSIGGINRAMQLNDRNIESHIYFDNGVRGERLTEFALQLVTVATKTLEVSIKECTKYLTPYGMRLTWELPSYVDKKDGMSLIIHLKDNQKVKNKKRWSQVMYMSWVLDYFNRQERTKKGKDKVTDINSFILTTDADVTFSPESVEALLDLMLRDPGVGAVCGRTHPMGSGPIYWYQIFDYAIGHWLLKAANHVMGSVLCCPGCFSVYRVAAVKDVLSTYASNVEEASEFLTKDMGEDRWLCTLMLWHGWRLEYSAVASCQTYVPEDFDEYFKQRRRWIPSSLANQWLLLKQIESIRDLNQQISLVFFGYQAALLIAAVLTPGVCILIMVGGLYFALGVQQVISTIVLCLVAIGYTCVCLKCSQKTQLKWAKILSVMLSLLMVVVVIGTIKEIVDENNKRSTAASDQLFELAEDVWQNLSRHRFDADLMATTSATTTTTTHPDSTTLDAPLIALPLSLPTLYLIGLVCIFVVTGLMHLPECMCLGWGILYLLCLPVSNLILMIYSLCNMTDRSWGTREEKTVSDFDKSSTWKEDFTSFLRAVFFCCADKRGRDQQTMAEVTANKGPQADVERFFTRDAESGVTFDCSLDDDRSHTQLEGESSGRFNPEGSDKTPLPVQEWLPYYFRDKYTSKFEKHGYENTGFIAEMTDEDLMTIGISSIAHRSAFMDEIKLLQGPEIEPFVPDNIGEWLVRIGLGGYRTQFRKRFIVSKNNLGILKTLSDRKDLQAVIGISKPGHLRRLEIAIQKLWNPTQTEKDMGKVKLELEALGPKQLKSINTREKDFWVNLQEKYLRPDSLAFARDLKEKLKELRNSVIVGFAITNALWVVLISTLVTSSELNVAGTNVLGLIMLVVFGAILVVQFVCMLIHRAVTLIHIMARAPIKCGAPCNAARSRSNSQGEESGDSSDHQPVSDTDTHNDGPTSSSHERRQAKKTTTRGRATRRQLEGDREPLLNTENPSLN